MRLLAGAAVHILLLACGCGALAAHYFVDASSGDDANPGSSRSKAWRTLEKVNRCKLSAGDRVVFSAGSTWTGQLVISAQGQPGRPIIFVAGRGKVRPTIHGGGLVEDTVLLRNAQHVVLRGLELTNDGGDRGGNDAIRRGVHVLAEDCGVLTNITVSDLYIHDVRGTQKRKENGGIVFTTRGQRVPSRFEGLRIERNIVWRVDRSGIVAQSTHANRERWFPSRGVVIRDNWVGDVGGDGITPWATDGCLVEHNIVQGANERAGTYNAGIWPWSTDNTVMRLNRASGVKTGLDGQGFDSDYNSQNTVLEYNLSHENEGGFLLVCTPGKREARQNCGNMGTVARHNISRYDRNRTLHVAGAPENTIFERNAVYIAPGHEVQVLLVSDWTGWAKGLRVRENLFHSEGTAVYGHQASRDLKTGFYGIETGWGPAEGVEFQGNRYVGNHRRPPGEPPGAAAPYPVRFRDWPGPQFDPAQPRTFRNYLKAHRAWMIRLMETQFGSAQQL